MSEGRAHRGRVWRSKLRRVAAYLLARADTQGNVNPMLPWRFMRVATGLGKRAAPAAFRDLEKEGLVTRAQVEGVRYLQLDEPGLRRYIEEIDAASLPARREAMGPPESLRRRIFDKSSGLCVYCERPADTLDHVIPRSLGGLTTESNLVAACSDCNNRKGSKLVEEFTRA